MLDGNSNHGKCEVSSNNGCCEESGFITESKLRFNKAGKVLGNHEKKNVLQYITWELMLIGSKKE